MTKNLDDINNRAQEKFIKLRHKLKLDVQRPHIQNAITLTQEKLNEMDDVRHAQNIFEENCQEAVQDARFVDNTFNFIESLKLPKSYSLAIGLIISAHKTNNINMDIEKAIEALKEEI